MNSATRRLPIFVFSYGRGRFLSHCLGTIEACAPDHLVIVIDDGSTDAETRAVLSEASRKHEVIVPEVSGNGGLDPKGLHGNMDLAVALSQERGYVRAVFLQDDMQMVRPFLDDDHERVAAIFEAVSNCIQIQTCFFRAAAVEGRRNDFKADPSGHAVVMQRQRTTGLDNYSDIGIFDTSRVQRLMGKFEVGEAKNNEKARLQGLVMPRYLYPFMNWLPYPTSFRGRRRGFLHATMEVVAGAGFHPIKIMSDAEARAFIAREPRDLPVAEHFLQAPTAPRADQWSTSGGEYNVLARGGWRAFGLRNGIGAGRIGRRIIRNVRNRRDP